MFRQAICTCEERYYKINYKYERCKHTKTSAYCKNISWSCGDLKFWLDVFHPINLMN